MPPGQPDRHAQPGEWHDRKRRRHPRMDATLNAGAWLPVVRKRRDAVIAGRGTPR